VVGIALTQAGGLSVPKPLAVVVGIALTQAGDLSVTPPSPSLPGWRVAMRGGYRWPVSVRDLS